MSKDAILASIRRGLKRGPLPADQRAMLDGRLATHPRVFDPPAPLVDAQAFLDAILSAPGVSMVSLGGEWAYFTALCARLGLTGNAIPDAWIAAAAHHHHLHLVTFDKGFRKLLKPSMVTVLKG